MPHLRLENDLHPVRGRVMRHSAKIPHILSLACFSTGGGVAMSMFEYISLIVCLFIREN